MTCRSRLLGRACWLLGALALLSCAEEQPEGQELGRTNQAQRRQRQVERELVLTLDASASMGGNCFDYIAADLWDRWERDVFDCSDAQDPQGGERFRASLEAAASNLERSLPTDGSVAVTVVLATPGRCTKGDNDNELKCEGGQVAIPRTRVTSVRGRAALATQIRSLVQPRVPNSDEQCLSDRVAECVPAGLLGRRLTQVEELVRAMPQDVRREVCAMGDLLDSSEYYVAKLSDVTDRLVLGHHIWGRSWLGVYKRRLVAVEGVAYADGVLHVTTYRGPEHAEFRLPPHEPTEEISSFDVPIQRGDDRVVIARKISEVVMANSEALTLHAEAHGGHVIFTHLAFGSPSLHVRGHGLGVQLTHDIGFDRHSRQDEEERVTVTQDLSEYGELSFVNTAWGRPALYAAEFDDFYSRCFAPPVRVRAIEVTQGLQDYQNSLPLLSGRRTMVRVHTRMDDDASTPAGGPGARTHLTLVGYRCNDDETGSTCTRGAELGRLAGANPDFRTGPDNSDPFADHERAPAEADLARGPWQSFVLPPSWRTGRIELVVERTGGSLACSSDVNLRRKDRTGCSTIVEFRPQTGEAIDIESSLVRFSTHMDDQMTPTLAEVAAEQERIRALMPLNFDTEPVAARTTLGDPIVLPGAPPPELLQDFADWSRNLSEAEIEAHGARVTGAANTAALETLRILLARKRATCTDDESCPRTLLHGLRASHDLGRFGIALTPLGGGVFDSSVEREPHDRVWDDGRTQSATTHELMHALGRPHAPYCMPLHLANSCSEAHSDVYPRAHEYGSRGVVPEHPLSVSPPWQRPALGPLYPEDHPREARTIRAVDQVAGRALNPWRTWDNMSYCDRNGDGRWLSRFQLERLLPGMGHDSHLEWFRNYPATPFPPECQPGFGCSEAAMRVCQALVDAWERADYSQWYELRHVDAMIDADGEVTLAPLFDEHDRAPIVPPEVGRYALRVEDETGAVLFEAPADPLELAHQDGPSGAASLLVASVPRSDRDHRVVILREGVEVASRMASPRAPSLTVGVPRSDEGDDQVHWDLTATDADGDALHYEVEYARDGEHFVPVALQDEASVALPLAWLRAATAARLRVTVSDGFHSRTAVSEPFAVPEHPPTVFIRSPLPAQRFFPGQSIVLDAHALDLEDGAILPQAVHWSSDRAGPLTLAEDRVAVDGLAPGVHHLIARVRDSAGTFAEAAVEVTVEARSAEELLPDLGVQLVQAASDDEDARLVLRNNGEVASGRFSLALLASSGAGPSVREALSCATSGSATTCEVESMEPFAVHELAVQLGAGDLELVSLSARLTLTEDRDASNDSAHLKVLRRVEEQGGTAAISLTIDGPHERGAGRTETIIHAVNAGDGRAEGPFVVQITLEAPTGATVNVAGEGWGCRHGEGSLRCVHEAHELDAGAALPPIAVHTVTPVQPEEPDEPHTQADAGTDTPDAALPDGGSATPEPDEGAEQPAPTVGVDLTVLAGDVRAVEQRPELADPGVPLHNPGARLAYDHGWPFRPGVSRETYLMWAYNALDYGRDNEVVNAPPAPPNHVWRSLSQPHQGGPWRYHVMVRNLGTEPTRGPVRVEVELPPDLEFSPTVERTGVSSLPDTWSCAQEGRLLRCTYARSIGAGVMWGPTLPLLFKVHRRASRVQPLRVRVLTEGDARSENDVVDDRLADVYQPWGPSLHDRAVDHLPETALEVHVEPSSTTAHEGDVMEALFEVHNAGEAPVALDALALEVLGAPSLVALEHAAGEGWECEPSWGAARCRYTRPGMLPPGAWLPAVRARFTLGASESGRMELPAAVFQAGARERTGQASVLVTSAGALASGELAFVGCPPRGDCRARTEPAVTRERVTPARVQLLDLTHRTRRELQFGDPSRLHGEGVPTDLAFDVTGTRLAVVSQRGIGYDLQEVAVDGVLPGTRMFERASLLSNGVNAPLASVAWAETGIRAHAAGPFLSVNGSHVYPLDDVDLLMQAQNDPAQQPSGVALSADGSTLAYHRGNPPRIWLVDVQRTATDTLLSAPRRLTQDDSPRREMHPAFSPDGREIAFSAAGRIVVARVDGGAERALTALPRAEGEEDNLPAFSRDGAWLAFARGPRDPYVDGHGYDAPYYAHRRDIEGAERTGDHAIVLVPTGGGPEHLIARGTRPVFRPEQAQVPAPPLPGAVGQREGPAAIAISRVPANVLLGEPVHVEGRVSADASVEGPVRVALVIDQHGLPARFRRGEAGITRRVQVGMPLSWSAAPAGAGATPCELSGVDFPLCQALHWSRELTDIAPVQVGVVGFGEDRYPETREPDYLVNSWWQDLDPGEETRAFALAGSPELEHALRGIHYGRCERLPGNRPGGRVQSSAQVECMNPDFETRSTYDDALATMNELFSTHPQAGARNVAYLLTSGRDEVTLTGAGPLAETILAETTVHVVTPEPAPEALDVVLVIDERRRNDEALRGLLDTLHGRLDLVHDVHVAVMGDVAPVHTHALATDPRVRLLPVDIGDSTPLTTVRFMGMHPDLPAGFMRPSAELHIVVVSDDERDGESRRELAEALQRPFTLHAVVPEGVATRPTRLDCNADRHHYARPAAVLQRMAVATGGVSESICHDDWSVVAEAVLRPGAGRDLSECDAPGSAARAIAELTGGTCTSAGFKELARSWLPWAKRSGGDAITQITLSAGANEARGESDGTGRFAGQLTGLTLGHHVLTAEVATARGERAQATAQVTVHQAPRPSDDTLVASMGHGSAQVLLNDLDPDGDALRVVQVIAPSHGVAHCTLEGRCMYDYVQPASAPRDSFGYVVEDARGARAEARVYVEIDSNRPPVASDLTVTLSTQGGSFDLRSVASDPDGDVLTFTALRPSRGEIWCARDGRCSYRANSGSAGNDTVFYAAQDARGASASGRVLVTTRTDAPHLTATALAASADVAAGATVDATVRVRNAGASDKQGVLMRARSSAMLTVVASGGEGWQCSAHELDTVCSQSVSVAPGSELAPLLLSIRASDDARGWQNLPLWVDGRIVPLSATVVHSVTDAMAGMTLPQSMQVGRVATVHGELRNAGTTELTSAALQVTIPAELDVVGVRGDTFACASIGGGLECTHTQRLMAGGAAAIQLDVVPREGAPERLQLALRAVVAGDAFPENDLLASEVLVTRPHGNGANACERGEPKPTVCGKNGQTFVDRCTLATEVGIASDGRCELQVPIPDAVTSGVLSKIDVVGGQSSRMVEVAIEIEHPRRGDLTVTIIQPNAAQRTVLRAGSNATANFTWRGTLDTGRQGVDGLFRLRVSDNRAGNEGHIRFFSVTPL